MNDIEIKLGDCLDLIRKLENESIDCILTDPPYFLGVTHNGMKGTYLDLNLMKPFFEQLYKEFKRVLKKEGCIYIFCDWRTYPFHYEILEKIINISNVLVWDKHGRPSKSTYGNGYEMIIFSGKINESYLSNVIKGVKSFNVFSKRELYLNDGKCHPTQKPLELMERFILDATQEKDVVMDCFMGSGTTGVACKRNNRRFIGFEISEEYFEIAKERINKQRKELKIDV